MKLIPHLIMIEPGVYALVYLPANAGVMVQS